MSAQDAAWQRLHDAATAPYLAAGRYAWHVARGKLGRDPVFRHLISTGCIAPGAHVVDIGCGQGLLTALLRAVDGTSAAEAAWPSTWNAAPTGARVTGIELTAADIARARRALDLPGQASASAFIHGDMRSVPLPPCDTVVLLDVLHYVDRAAQDALLIRVAAALAPSGRLLLRVGDAGTRGHAIGDRIDRLVARARGYRVAPGSARSLDAWIELLQKLGFTPVAHPMSQGTPFANVLLVCDRGREPPSRLQGILDGPQRRRDPVDPPSRP